MIDLSEQTMYYVRTHQSGTSRCVGSNCCWSMYLLLFKQTDHTRSLEESDYHEVLQKDDWNLVKSFPRLKMQRKTHSEIKDCKLRLKTLPYLLVG